MTEAIFRIKTEYLPKELRSFSRDLKSIKQIVTEVNQISRSSGGLQRAVRNVRNFATSINQLGGPTIGNLQRVGRAMANMAWASEATVGISGELKRFSTELRSIGEASKSQSSEMQKGQAAVKSWAKSFKELCETGKCLRTVAEHLTQINKVVHTEPRSYGVIGQIISLCDVKSDILTISRALERISKLKLDIRGMYPPGGGGGAGVAVATPMAEPKAHTFRTPEIRAAGQSAVAEILDKPTIENAQKEVDRFLMQMIDPLSKVPEQAEGALKFFGMMKNDTQKGHEDLQTYINRMRGKYEQSVEAMGGIRPLSATAMAKWGTGGGFPAIGGAMGPQAAMGAFRGTLMHESMAKFFQQSIATRGGELKRSFQEMFRKYGSPEAEKKLLAAIKPQAEFARREFMEVAAKAQIADEPWVRNMADKIYTGVEKNIRSAIEFMRAKIREQGLSYRRGLKEIRLQVEKPIAPVEVMAPKGTTGLAFEKRIPEQHRAMVQNIVKNIERLGTSEDAAYFKRAVDQWGLTVQGIADITGKIGTKGFVIDLKTGKETLESMRSILIQVQKFYAEGLKGVFPGVETVEGYRMNIEGDLASMKEIRDRLAGQVAGARTAEMPTRTPEQRAAKEKVTATYMQQELESAKKIANEELKQEASQKRQVKAQTTLTEQASREREARQASASASERTANAVRSAVAAGGGVGGGGVGGGGRGGPEFPSGGMVRGQIAVPTEWKGVMTGYEQSMNQIVLEAIAFNKEIDVTQHRVQRANQEVQKMAKWMSQVVNIESVRTSKHFKAIEAQEKINMEMAEYVKLQKQAQAAEAKLEKLKRTQTQADVQRLRQLKRMTSLTEAEKEELKPLEKADRKVKEYQKSMLVTNEAIDEYNTAMVTAMNSTQGTGEQLGGLAGRFRDYFDEMGIGTRQVKDVSEAMQVLTRRGAALHKDVALGEDVQRKYTKTIRELRREETALTKGRIFSSLQLEKIQPLHENLTKQVKTLQNQLAGLNEVQRNYIREGKGQSSAAKETARQQRRVAKDLADTQKRYQDVNEQMKLFSGNSEQMRGDLRSTLLGFKNMLKSQMAWIAGYAVMFGVLRQFQEMLSSVIDLQTQVARAMRTSRSEMMATAHVQRDYIEAMEATMIRMGVSSEEAGEMLYQLGSAGLSAEESLAALKSTMDAIVGVEEDVTEYTKAVAGVYNNFADQIEHVVSLQESFQYINDVMVATFRDHQVEMNELREGLKHLTAAGKASNLQFHQIAAILGTLNDHMIKSGIAGRSVQSVLSRITRQSYEFAKAFDIEIAYDKPLDFIDILKQVNEQLEFGALTSDEVGQIFERLGLRGAKAFIQLAENVEELLENIGILENESRDAAREMAKIMMATPERDIMRLTQAFQKLGREIFDIYVILYRDLARVIADTTQATNEWSKENREVAGFLMDVTSAAVNATIAITVLLAAIRFITKGINFAIGGISKWFFILTVATTALVVLVEKLKATDRQLEKHRAELAKARQEYRNLLTEASSYETEAARLTRVLEDNYEAKRLDSEASKDLAASHTQLIERYDEEGEAILKTTEELQKYVDEVKEAEKATRELAKARFAETMPDELKTLRITLSDATEAMKEYRKSTKEYLVPEEWYWEMRPSKTMEENFKALRKSREETEEEREEDIRNLDKWRTNSIEVYEQLRDSIELYRNQMGDDIGSMITYEQLQENLLALKNFIIEASEVLEKESPYLRVAEKSRGEAKKVLGGFRTLAEDVTAYLRSIGKDADITNLEEVMTSMLSKYREMVVETRMEAKPFTMLPENILGLYETAEDILREKGPLPFFGDPEEMTGEQKAAILDIIEAAIDGWKDGIEGLKAAMEEAFIPEDVMDEYAKRQTRINEDAMFAAKVRLQQLNAILSVSSDVMTLEELRQQLGEEGVKQLRKQLMTYIKTGEIEEGLSSSARKRVEAFKEWFETSVKIGDIEEERLELARKHEIVMSQLADDLRDMWIAALPDVGGLRDIASSYQDESESITQAMQKRHRALKDLTDSEKTMGYENVDIVKKRKEQIESLYTKIIEITKERAKAQREALVEEAEIERRREIEDISMTIEGVTADIDNYISANEELAEIEREARKELLEAERAVEEKRQRLVELERETRAGIELVAEYTKTIEMLKKNQIEGNKETEKEILTKEKNLKMLKEVLERQEIEKNRLEAFIDLYKIIIDAREDSLELTKQEAELKERQLKLEEKSIILETAGEISTLNFMRTQAEYAQKRIKLERMISSAISENLITEARAHELRAKLAERESKALAAARVADSKAMRDRMIKDLGDEGQAILELGIKAEKGFGKAKAVAEGLFKSITDGVWSNVLSLQDLGAEAQKIGATIASGMEDVALAVIQRPDQEIAQTRSEIRRIRSELSELSKKRREVGLTEQEINQYQALNKELRQHNRELDKMKSPMERAKKAWRNLADEVVKQINKMVARLIVLFIWQKLTGLFGSGDSSFSGVASRDFAPKGGGSGLSFGEGTIGGVGAAKGGFVQKELVKFAKMQKGGVVPATKAFRMSGLIRGGTPGVDSVPIMAMPGEYFVRKDLVRHYGLNFFKSLEQKEVGKMQYGGFVQQKPQVNYVPAGDRARSDEGERGGDNYFFIQTNDVDSFRRLLEANGETVSDIALGAIYQDSEENGIVTRKLERRR